MFEMQMKNSTGQIVSELPFWAVRAFFIWRHKCEYTASDIGPIQPSVPVHIPSSQLFLIQGVAEPSLVCLFSNIG